MTKSIRNNTIVTAISKIGDRPKAKDACLVVIYGQDLGKKFSVTESEIIIGRSSKADIRIDQESVSRNHCKIRNTGDAVFAQDLQSTNGTYVNDTPVTEHCLNDGDLIKVGRSILKYLGGDNIESSYHEAIYHLTTVDGLTEVYNKRYFLEMLDREVGRAQRYHRDLSIVMFDLDHFKQVNDEYGHLAGDHVLKQLSLVIKTRIRREDVFARYGGEEFIIALPEIGIASALQFSEKIRELAERSVFSFDNVVIPVTISVGVAGLDATTAGTKDFLQQVDENLYAAKERGRNCVVG